MSKRILLFRAKRALSALEKADRQPLSLTSALRDEPSSVLRELKDAMLWVDTRPEQKAVLDAMEIINKEQE